MAFDVVYIVPPFRKKRVGNQLKPRCNALALMLRSFDEVIEMFFLYIVYIHDFIGIWADRNGFFGS